MAKKHKGFLEKTVYENIGLVLCLLFFIGVSLRFFYLPQTLFFGPEQGIDFQRIKSVAVDHRPVLVGAKTDVAGVFHGPIYYYISSIPFVLSNGNPILIAYILIVINCLSVFLLYRIGESLFNKRTGLIASVLFVVSFNAISYTHWLSSHPLVIPLSAVFILGFAKFLRGEKKYLLLASISYALLGQAEFLNYIFFAIAALIILVFSIKSVRKLSIPFILLNVIIVGVFGFLHYAVFELRNNFIMTHSLLSLAGGKGYYVSFEMVAKSAYSIWLLSLVKTILPFIPSAFALVVFVVSLICFIRFSKKDAKVILLSILFTPIILLIILRHDVLEQFFVYSITATILVVAFFSDFLIQRKKLIGIVFLFVMVAIQLFAWSNSYKDNKKMFFAATQPEMYIKDEKKVIDEIYKRQDGKDFSFQSYTIPYWTQDGWEYLFWQRGKGTYGYEPVKVNGRTLYVIIQDDPSSKKFQDDWLKYTVSKWGVYRESFRYGAFTVQILDVPSTK